MNSNSGSTDPQWDLALVIKAALERHGRFVIEVDTRDTQALADIQWAARQAGRLLDAKVKIDRSSHYGHADSIVTATVRCIENGCAGQARAEEGRQELLLQAVQEAQPDRLN